MKRFRPVPDAVADLPGYIREFVRRVEQELDDLRKKIPKPGPSMEQILQAVREDAPTKDAIYRYIKEREERENESR